MYEALQHEFKINKIEIMTAAVFKNTGLIEITDYPLKELNENELLVEVGYCGVCGTDRRIYKGESHANPPVILGHEYAGKVVEVGKNVTEYHCGDNVAVDPNIFCGVCEYCREGKINYCNNLKALGVNYDGGFAQYSIVPANQAYLLPENFRLDVAAFAEPLSCCIRGIQQADMKLGDSVAIIGAGSIGLLMLQLVQRAGCSKLIIIEPNSAKQKIAIDYGADFVFAPDKNDLLKNIYDLTSGGVDVVIECAGTTDAAELALQLPKKGGSVVIFGVASNIEDTAVNFHSVMKKELTIKGSLLNPFTFQEAVRLLAEKQINVEKFNSVKVNLENINSIFDNQPDSLAVKYQIYSNIN